MAVIEKKYTVGVRDVGEGNLLTNKGILEFLEQIACVHSEIAGYGINQMESTHLSWVLLHWKVRILKRVAYNSSIIVKTWSRNANKIITYRDFEIYDENNELVCIATSKWALISTENAGILKISPEVINSYNPEDNKNVFGKIDIPKLREPENISASNPVYTFTVQRRDIDMNHHFHNTYYLDYGIESLPQEIYENLDCNEFEIMYKNGAKYGDKVNCYYINENDNHFVVMKSDNDDRLHAIIKFCS